MQEKGSKYECHAPTILQEPEKCQARNRNWNKEMNNRKGQTGHWRCKIYEIL